jgi:hypothetical protein
MLDGQPFVIHVNPQGYGLLWAAWRLSSLIPEPFFLRGLVNDNFRAPAEYMPYFGNLGGVFREVEEDGQYILELARVGEFLPNPVFFNAPTSMGDAYNTPTTMWQDIIANVGEDYATLIANGGVLAATAVRTSVYYAAERLVVTPSSLAEKPFGHHIGQGVLSV